MNGFLISIGFLVILAVVFAVAQYNKLIRFDNYAKTAWSNIDNQLDAKARILTNVIQVLEMGYEKEKEFINSAIMARQGLQEGSVEEKAKANETVQKDLLPKMSLLMEAYPESKTSESLSDAIEKITQCEDKITYARTAFNKSVENFNILIKQFPTVIFANTFGYNQPKTRFEITEEKRESYGHMSVNDIRKG